MNGRECVLESIVFGDEEELPDVAVAGQYISFRYVPASLLLRVVDAPWILPATELPDLSSVNRRDLSQLRPGVAYLRVASGKDKYMSVRGTQFPVLPGDMCIVYGAQGETFDAVLLDMQRPPRMELGIHWLACYVMISRATSINELLVPRSASYAELNSPPPRKLLDEIDRLLPEEQGARRYSGITFGGCWAKCGSPCVPFLLRQQ